MDIQDPIAIATVVSDIIISLSYFAIPIELWFFQRSLTRPLPFKFVLVFFEVFITACGITHVVAIWAPWTRTDPALLAVKALCAIVSFATACVLIFVIPKVFSLPVKTALLQEELGFRIKHEQSLQVANDALRKFRKITNQLRKKLDIEVICDVLVHELADNLNFSGIAIFLPDEVNGDLICYSEYIKYSNSNKEHTNIKTHYWKTINVDLNNDIVKKIINVTCALHLNCNDMVELINKQRGTLYKGGLAMSFEMSENGSRGFVLGFNEQDNNLLSEEDFEMFEDILKQLEIALQQARQIQMESYHLKKIQNQMRNNQNLYQMKQDADINNQFKTKLISFINKEFNAPIHYLKEFITNLNNTSLDSEQLILLNGIQYNHNQLNIIMKDLEDYIKLESNQLYLINQPFEINQLITLVFDQMKLLADNKSIRLHYNILDNVPLNLIGDQLRLRQALSQLVNNSIQFSNIKEDIIIYISLREEPPVNLIPFLKDSKCTTFNSQFNQPFMERNSKNLILPIETDPTLPQTYLKTEIYFHVVDYGIGMRSDQISKIIRSINQFNNDKRDDDLLEYSDSNDLGLGLWVISHLVKLFQGNLSIHSCKGKGTVFSFSAKLFISSNEEI